MRYPPPLRCSHGIDYILNWLLLDGGIMVIIMIMIIDDDAGCSWL
jgi:hypothetical protein